MLLTKNELIKEEDIVILKRRKNTIENNFFLSNYLIVCVYIIIIKMCLNYFGLLFVYILLINLICFLHDHFSPITFFSQFPFDNKIQSI